MSAAYVPSRGDVVWLQVNPQSGHEQAGKRPALIVSARAYNNKVGLALACPLTTRAKGYPFEVHIPEGLKARGVVLSDQIKSLDWRARKATKICTVPHRVLDEVIGKIEVLLHD